SREAQHQDARLRGPAPLGIAAFTRNNGIRMRRERLLERAHRRSVLLGASSLAARVAGGQERGALHAGGLEQRVERPARLVDPEKERRLREHPVFCVPVGPGQGFRKRHSASSGRFGTVEKTLASGGRPGAYSPLVPDSVEEKSPCPRSFASPSPLPPSSSPARFRRSRSSAAARFPTWSSSPSRAAASASSTARRTACSASPT